MEEEWFTLEDIEESNTDDTLYCISVDSPSKQFLIGDLGVPTHNTDEGKEQDKLKGEAAQIIGSIARLGRASGVHLIIATQRPDAKLIAGETKANLGVRINCGTTDSNASSMILGSSEGTRVKSTPRGRLYLSIYQKGDHGQGFFAEQSWIDEYLKNKGLNPDGTPMSSNKKQSQLAHIADMDTFEEADLDSMSGVDNSAIIEKIREDEANDDFDNLMNEDDDFVFEDNEESQPELETEPTEDNKLGRPDLSAGKNKNNSFHRPEEDWDTELEELIEENHNM